MDLHTTERTQINLNIWKNLELIQSAKRFTDEKMAELLGARLGDYRTSKEKRKAPSLLALIRLSRQLDIELSDIYFKLPEDFVEFH